MDGFGAPLVTKTEMEQLFAKENAMCKINFKEYSVTGFFIKLNTNLKGLLACNHTINNISLNTNISIEYLNQTKIIKITEDRKVCTNKELDYTFIQILESDAIQNFFEIYPNEDINKLKGQGIFLLHYPCYKGLAFSCGVILDVDEEIIKHNASTDIGSSGAPIILTGENNYIIGLQIGCIKFKERTKYKLGTFIHSILNDINESMNGS